MIPVLFCGALVDKPGMPAACVRSSKCKCSSNLDVPAALPVSPDLAIISPSLTLSPSSTRTSERWA